MDTNRIDRGTAIAGGGAALLLLSLFLDWYGPASAWQLFRLVDILLALLAVVVLALVVMQLVGASVDLPAPAGTIIAAAGAIALIITFAFLLESTDLGIGLILALLASAGVTFGGVTGSRSGPAIGEGRRSPSQAPTRTPTGGGTPGAGGPGATA